MLILPPLCGALIHLLGWRGTSMIAGVGCAALLVVAAALVRLPPLSAAEAPLPLGGIVM
jgi:hypothetical protein